MINTVTIYRSVCAFGIGNILELSSHPIQQLKHFWRRKRHCFLYCWKSVFLSQDTETFACCLLLMKTVR